MNKLLTKCYLAKAKKFSKSEQMFHENGCVQTEICEQTVNKYLFFCEQIKQCITH